MNINCSMDLGSHQSGNTTYLRYGQAITTTIWVSDNAFQTQVPQQDNNVDCGVYLLAFARAVIFGQSPTELVGRFGPSEILAFRQETYISIVSHASTGGAPQPCAEVTLPQALPESNLPPPQPFPMDSSHWAKTPLKSLPKIQELDLGYNIPADQE